MGIDVCFYVGFSMKFRQLRAFNDGTKAVDLWKSQVFYYNIFNCSISFYILLNSLIISNKTRSNNQAYWLINPDSKPYCSNLFMESNSLYFSSLCYALIIAMVNVMKRYIIFHIFDMHLWYGKLVYWINSTKSIKKWYSRYIKDTLEATLSRNKHCVTAAKIGVLI